MKFGELRSIGHNIADSLASGIGLLIGVYGMNIFGEADRSREGVITVDFLSGKTSGGRPSSHLARGIALYRDALDELCEKHGASRAVFRELTACYSKTSTGNKRFIVTVVDQNGRRSIDTYMGVPGRRIRTLDHLGRIRRVRTLANYKR